jgi:hypothetical protein
VQVEGAVAAHEQAQIFVGTGLSSVSESITYERLALGHQNNWIIEGDDCSLAFGTIASIGL